ncbi:MAG TPA: hypothetical protein VII25_04555 [Candidatus Acidoferrum sp.]
MDSVLLAYIPQVRVTSILSLEKMAYHGNDIHVLFLPLVIDSLGDRFIEIVQSKSDQVF